MTKRNSAKTKLLRRKKFYIKAKNRVCALCSDGFGCCKGSSSIYFESNDFSMDFTNKDDVKALLNTNLFSVALGARDWDRNKLTVYIKKRNVGKRKDVCVFWNTKGCVLKHDSRPSLCRYTDCGNMGEGMKRNISDTSKRRPRKEWSYEELLTVLQVMYELDLNNKGYMSKKEFEAVDWKHVLRVL